MRRRVNRDTKHILYSNMSGEFKSVLEDGPIEGEPLVSVCVITYNHGKYIRQCLDGILMQKVNFPYEILIHDDASPDDTADIIREYWEKYPTVIKPILQTENQYSKGVDVCRFNFDRAKAKYIAQCEGDDYWTDDGKLQMQVDFLEEHGEYVACVHRVKVIDGEGNDIRTQNSQFTSGYNTKDFTIASLDNPLGNECAGHLSSLLYKNIYTTLSNNILEGYYACKCNGDTKLTLLLVLNGDVKRFGETMSVYRRDDRPGGTSWTSRNRGIYDIKRDFQWLDELNYFAKTYYSCPLMYSRRRLSYIFSSIIYFIRNRDHGSWGDVKYSLMQYEISLKIFSDMLMVGYYYLILLFRKIVR